MCYNVEVKQGPFGYHPNKLAPILKYLGSLLSPPPKQF